MMAAVREETSSSSHDEPPAPRKKRAQNMAFEEMLELVRIFDSTDYDCRKGPYRRKNNARKDRILDKLRTTILEMFGKDRTKDQLRKRWSDLKVREQEQLRRIRRVIAKQHSEIQDLVQKKDDQLLSRLKEVYVDSTDRSLEMESKVVPTSEQVDHRLPKLTARSEFSALVDVKSIPTGKVSILETLTILGNHRSYPDIWTAEKIAREFNLDVRDCQSLLEYFIPFTVKLIPRTNTKELTET
uniref:NADH dehydrogenase [ubiquinone] 1 alpha subcomplex assembly factor 4 n=1 Tax=Leptobrachium leishanense TaxID=445787 RepID=A0A8C5QXP0_9ANUR